MQSTQRRSATLVLPHITVPVIVQGRPALGIVRHMKGDVWSYVWVWVGNGWTQHVRQTSDVHLARAIPAYALVF